MIPNDLNDAVAPEVDDGSQAAGVLAQDNPAAIVDEAVQSGTASTERPETEVAPSDEDLVKTWWAKTSQTADFTAAVERQVKDKEAIEGGTKAEIDDPASVTIRHIYRNAIQGIAQTVPAITDYDIVKRDEVEPLPGMPTPPEIANRNRQRDGFASVLKILFQHYSEDCNLDEKTESWVQESFHFRAAIFKIWFQRDLSEDPVGSSRLPDEQDLLAKLRVLIERYNNGEFTQHDAQYAEMQNCMRSIGKTELNVRRGLVVESIPLNMYRCDPAVTNPAYIDRARWERNDVLMTEDEILAEWPKIAPDDLCNANTYSIDEAGRAAKMEKEDQTSTSHQVNTANQPNNTKTSNEKWYLVAEIYDYETNTRLVLVEGLNYPVVKEPLVNQPTGMSPFVVLVENPKIGSLYGFSDTELQEKSQSQVNKMRSQEEDARRNAQPRWAANASAFESANDLNRVESAGPWSVTPLKVISGKTLAEEMVPIPGNHEFQPLEFDGTKHIQEMRKMAMLPEQAMGELGNAEFAEEVKAATAGANALAKYRQTRIARALQKLAEKAVQLILMNVDKETAVKIAGPMAAMFYPDSPLTRQEIYESLYVKVELPVDRQLDYARKATAAKDLIDVFNKTGVMYDKEALGRLMGKYLGIGRDFEGIIKSDPNDLIGRLAEAMQKDPTSVAPESFGPLIQLGQMAQQMAMQMAAQQATQKQQTSGAMPTGAMS